MAAANHCGSRSIALGRVQRLNASGVGCGPGWAARRTTLQHRGYRADWQRSSPTDATPTHPQGDMEHALGRQLSAKAAAFGASMVANCASMMETATLCRRPTPNPVHPRTNAPRSALSKRCWTPMQNAGSAPWRPCNRHRLRQNQAAPGQTASAPCSSNACAPPPCASWTTKPPAGSAVRCPGAATACWRAPRTARPPWAWRCAAGAATMVC